MSDPDKIKRAVQLLWAEGMRDREIAKRLGYSHSHIKHLRVGLGLKSHESVPVYNAELRAQVYKLWEEGYSDQDIAIAVGRAKQRVTQVRRELGLPTKRGLGGLQYSRYCRNCARVVFVLWKMLATRK
jgi:IS30 family transposase